MPAMRSVAACLVFALAGFGAVDYQGAQLHEGYADIPGARVWYRDSGGNGLAVVFLHAATGSSRVWEHQEAAFVAAGYRFIAYDRRGFGRTTTAAGRPPGTGADDLQALASALRL